MIYHRFRNPRLFTVTPLVLFLLLVLACGGAATAPPAPAATTAPAATEPAAAPESTPAAPAAEATPVPAAVKTLEPSTTLTEKSLHLAVTPMPQDTFLPWKASSSGHLVFRPIFENLTTIDPHTGPSKIYPQLATDWEMSPDAQSWTFHLRKGVPFHFNQGEFTAKDLIPSIDKAMEVGSLTGCRGSMSAMMGAESATQMMQQGNLQMPDDYTLILKLARPQVDVASWWFNILEVPCAEAWSSAQFEAEGEAMFENGPAGTGAYQLANRVLKEYTEYERVPYDHWRVNPEFKTLRISTIPEDATRLAMILTGEADMVDIPKVLHDQAINAGKVVLESPLPAVGLHVQMYGQYYVSEVNYTPAENPWAAPGETGRLVREALNRAVNREEIINVLFEGRGEPMYNTIFHPSLGGWNPRWEEEFDEKYGYDPELAKQLLDQAGFSGQNGQNRFKMEVRASSLPGLPETIEVSQSLAQAFEDIGIDVELTETEYAQVLDATRDQHDAHFILPLRQTVRPIMQNIRIYYYTGPIDEATGLPKGGSIYNEDPLFERVYEALLSETDPEKRDQLARELGDYAYDQYRTIPIVNIKATLVTNPDVVEEYVFGGVTGVFSHLEYAKAVK
jgi:peptide/nickel transport system substrate-binding protein